MVASARDAALAAVLGHNDAYLEGLVEPWDICPFAKRCRTEGQLWRAVVWATDPDDAGRRIDALISALHAAEAGPEVALLLCPSLGALSPKDFAAVHLAARERYAQPKYYVVAFHPELPLDDRTPGSLVHFWRRSPHPTLQFVSVDLLARVRRVDQQHDPTRVALSLAAQGLEPEAILEALDAMRPHRPVSERVAEDNAATFHRAGAAPFEAHQREVAAQVAADVDRLGPWQAAWADAPWTPTG